MYSRRMIVLFIVTAIFSISGCVNYQRETGAENLWRSDSQQFKRGATTSADVLEKLGPPSQVLGIIDKTLFYYLQERVVGTSYIFLIFNKSEETTTFDRAMFIFDENGILEDYALSKKNDASP